MTPWTIASGSSTRGAPAAVDEPAHERARRTAAPTRVDAGDGAGDRVRAGLGADEQDDRQAVDADRRAGDQRRREQPRDVRRAQDRGVPQAGGHGASGGVGGVACRRGPARRTRSSSAPITTVTCSSKSTPSSSAPCVTSSRLTAAAKLGCFSFFFTDFGVSPWMPWGRTYAQASTKPGQLVDGVERLLHVRVARDAP